MVESDKHFYHNLYGIEFKVRTDHGAFSWLLRFAIVEGQLYWWLQVLSTYDFKIEHLKAKCTNFCSELSNSTKFHSTLSTQTGGNTNIRFVPVLHKFLA